MRIAIVVLSSDGEFTKLVDGIRRTWGSIKNSDIDIYYNYCYRHIEKIPTPKNNEVILHEDQIICGYNDGKHEIHRKTIDAFQWLVNNKKYDYVFRCCCGSYVIQENLIKFLQDKPRENFYSGILAKTSHGIFCSGSGFFLSWDLVKDLVENRNRIPVICGSMDDVNIGKYLTVNKKITPISGFRYDYGWNNEDLTNIECLKMTDHGFEGPDGTNVPKPPLGYNYHFHISHSFSGNCFDSLHQCYLNRKFC